MPYPTKGVVVLLMCAWGLLPAGLIPPGPVPIAQASDRSAIQIHFDDIEAMIETESPRARIIAQRLAATRAERDATLQWSNPALAFDQEATESAREWQVTLHKRFDMPFNQSSRRAGWSDRVQSAELLSDQEAADLAAALKSGYVRLALLDDYLVRLGSLADLMTRASASAESQFQEGERAGTEAQLIRLSALSLEAEHRRTIQRRRQLAAGWRAELGVPVAGTLSFATPIAFRPVTMEDLDTYALALDESPGVRARAALVRALGKQSEGARPSLLPGLEVYGGYRSFASDEDGFVAGVALDLPLFDRRAGAARTHEANRLIAENELALHVSSNREEVAALVYLIEAAQGPLAEFTDRLELVPGLTDALLLSLREGSLSLDAFLNSIQVEAAALSIYFEELTSYYENIFRLQAITGADIVRFGS